MLKVHNIYMLIQITTSPKCIIRMCIMRAYALCICAHVYFGMYVYVYAYVYIADWQKSIFSLIHANKNEFFRTGLASILIVSRYMCMFVCVIDIYMSMY